MDISGEGEMRKGYVYVSPNGAYLVNCSCGTTSLGEIEQAVLGRKGIKCFECGVQALDRERTLERYVRVVEWEESKGR